MFEDIILEKEGEGEFSLPSFLIQAAFSLLGTWRSVCFSAFFATAFSAFSAFFISFILSSKRSWRF